MGFFDRFKNKFERSVGESRAVLPAAEAAAASKNEAKPVAVRPIEVSSSVYAHHTLSHAYVTEKSATLAHGRTYVFVVPLHATKLTVKNAVAETYGVMPTSVRIIRRAGKMVRFGRTNGQRKDWKKAYVTIPEGKTLPIYE